MKEGQKQIYYLTGSSIEQLEKSPFLEKLLKKGYEVSGDSSSTRFATVAQPMHSTSTVVAGAGEE